MQTSAPLLLEHKARPLDDLDYYEIAGMRERLFHGPLDASEEHDEIVAPAIYDLIGEDRMLAAQWASMRDLTGGQRAAWAMIAQALIDMQRTLHGRPNHTHPAAEGMGALLWVLYPVEAVAQFGWCCAALGLSEGALRATIVKWVQGGVPLRAVRALE